MEKSNGLIFRGLTKIGNLNLIFKINFRKEKIKICLVKFFTFHFDWFKSKNMTSTFPFDSFVETLNSFCISSYGSFLSENIRTIKEKEAVTNQQNIWKQRDVDVPSQVTLEDGSTVKFTYRYKSMDFNQQSMDNFVVM
jgi:hypothetical protein